MGSLNHQLKKKKKKCSGCSTPFWPATIITARKEDMKPFVLNQDENSALEEPISLILIIFTCKRVKAVWFLNAFVALRHLHRLCFK